MKTTESPFWLMRADAHLPWIMALLAGVAYAFTLAPAIGHTDAGELAAVTYTFGVAHPTGYPLFTALGWLASHIPLGTVIWRLNALCLMLVAGGVWAWAIVLRALLRKTNGPVALRFTALVLGTALLALGRTWWTQATGIEVYALHCLLMVLAVWTLFRATEKGTPLRWGMFTFILALCFANHLTSIVLLPGVVYLALTQVGLGRKGLKLGIAMAGIFLGVLVVAYGSLMLTAQTGPAYNWGNPEDWPRLWHHLTGKQFRSFMFLGPQDYRQNLSGYFGRLPGEFGVDATWASPLFGVGLLLLAIAGTRHALRQNRPWAIFFLLGFVSNLFWGAVYSIKDPEPYFLFCWLTIAFWVPMVLHWAWLSREKAGYLLAGLVTFILFFQVGGNYSAVDQRGVWQYEDYARAVLNSLPPDAIVVSRSWDVLIGPACYLQACEGLRPDVALIDYNLLRDRHWYAAQLRVQAPGLAQALGSTLPAWEEAVSDFDLQGEVNPTVLQPRFNALFFTLLQQAAKRPVYIGPEVMAGAIRKEIPVPVKELMPVPDQYLIRLLPTAAAQTYLPAALPNAPIRFGGAPEEAESLLLRRQLKDVWAMRVRYETQAGHPDAAAAWQRQIARLP